MKDQINFTEPYYSGEEMINLNQLMGRGKFSGDGHFTKQSTTFLENMYGVNKVLLTTSCTHSLEMAAILLDIRQGDEIIMPSFTFVSTANAFLLRGARIVFVDISPDDLNIDLNFVESAVTSKTKAIVAVHYAGRSCDMHRLLSIAKKHKLFVIEDAAQAIGSKFDGQYLGTFGDLGCISFHDTKNIHCGEGGALYVNNMNLASRAEVIREKGTNRSQFIRHEVDKYTWHDIGSSYLMSELNAAFLFGQLSRLDAILNYRKALFQRYIDNIEAMQLGQHFTYHSPSKDESHNAHIFYIILETELQRDSLIDHLREHRIQSVFHYVPLHSSPAGLRHSSFFGMDIHTSSLSSRLLRLPLHNNLTLSDIDYVCRCVRNYFVQSDEMEL